jgi:hypothetical protein
MILVDIDLCEGILYVMEIEMGKWKYRKFLDYWKIPLRCRMSCSWELGEALSLYLEKMGITQGSKDLSRTMEDN